MATLVCLAIILEMSFLSAITMEVVFVRQEAQVERRQYKPHEVDLKKKRLAVGRVELKPPLQGSSFPRLILLPLS